MDRRRRPPIVVIWHLAVLRSSARPHAGATAQQSQQLGNMGRPEKLRVAHGDRRPPPHRTPAYPTATPGRVQSSATNASWARGPRSACERDPPHGTPAPNGEAAGSTHAADGSRPARRHHLRGVSSDTPACATRGRRGRLRSAWRTQTPHTGKTEGHRIGWP